jgi:neutral amino acid transport system permease protein
MVSGSPPPTHPVRRTARPHKRSRSHRPASWRAGLLGALATLLLALLLAPWSAPSAAADSEGEVECDDTQVARTVEASLNDTANAGTPVEGAVITVRTGAGDEYVGETDDSGSVTIEFCDEFGAPVTIELDEDSLPEGATLRKGASASLTNSTTLPTIQVDFQIGPDTRNVETSWDRLPGLVFSGLMFGLILALASMGLSMVFGTTGLTNFAHGELVGLGTMIAYLVSVPLGVPFLLAVPVTVLLGMAFGWAQYRGLWRPLRHRGTSLIAMMIVSIGMQLAMRYLFQFFTGGQRLNYKEYLTPDGRSFAGLFTYTYRDIAVAAVSIAVLLAVILALTYTRLGRATRAVSDNPALAASTGINVDKIIGIVWVIGTGLAALSGVFLGFTLGVNYDIGQLVLLLLFAAVILGGLGSVWGALVGSLIIGVLLDVSTLVINAEVKNAGALMLLVLILLVRPQGLLGRKERVG